MSAYSCLMLLTLGTVAAPAPDNGPVCKWNLEKGKTYYLTLTTDVQQLMKVQGQEITQAQKQIFYTSWTVLRQEGAGWVLRYRIEGVKMEIDIGGNKIAFDSTQPAQANNNPLEDFFKALVGAEFVYTLNRDMKVVGIEGREAFIKKLTDANPAMKTMLEPILNESALKQMSDALFAALPPRALEKGETWVHITRLDMGPVGQYQIAHEYLFQGKGTRYADFKVDNIHFKYEAPQNNAGGALPFTITQANLKSTKGSGSVRFDLEKGRLDRSEMLLEIEGPMDIEIGGQTTTLELRQSQKTTTQVTETNPLKK